ncbi:MAG: hypothetical protein WD176_07900, partial [Pirellulales bacterium]
STVATLAYVLRSALEGWEPYIWIVSDTRQQAWLHLENVKCELMDNRRLARAYPASVGRGSVWRSGAIVLANGVMIEGLGTLQRIRGRRRRDHRPTLIVCDDLQNDRHAESAEQRSLSDRWFHTALLPAGTGSTNVINLATALHRDALALRLERAPGWISRRFRAVEEWPANSDLWSQWEALYTNCEDTDRSQTARAFYDARRADMDAGGRVLWPEQEDLYALACLRLELGRAAFEREKQSSPVSPELCEWPEEYFASHIWFDQWPARACVKTIALDPSKGSDARVGDYSAFACLAIDAQGVVYIAADLARRPTPQIVADGVELYRQFQPDGFAIEANQFQELLGREFVAEFQRQGMLGVNPWTMTNTANKNVRIRRLAPYLATRRMRFKAHCPGTRLLVEQLRDFPIGEHDDGPDAAEMALRLAAVLIEGRTEGESRLRLSV